LYYYFVTLFNGFLWVFGRNLGSRCALVRIPTVFVLQGHVDDINPLFVPG